MYKPSLSYLNSLLLDGKVRALLVGFVLNVLGDGPLANSSFNSFVEAALDLITLPWRNVGVEQNVNLLQCLPVSFGIAKEDVEGHGEAENAKNDVSLPLNVGEGRSNKVCLAKS
jgi:hypothetical protein